VETWIARLSTTANDGKPYSYAVVKACYDVLAGIVDLAVRAERVPSNKVRQVTNLPKRNKRRHSYLTADDVERITEQCLKATRTDGDRNATIVFLLAYCGLRLGEMAALRVRDIDFLRRRMRISTSAMRTSDGIEDSSTKNRKTRWVAIPAFLVPMLATRCEGRTRDRLVFGDGTKHLGKPTTRSGWWDGAQARAGTERIRIHDLRHTCASLAVNNGASVLALANMLGHADPGFTLKEYADLFDDSIDAVAVALDAVRPETKRGQYVGKTPAHCPTCGHETAA
jgi:integrase